MNILLMIFFVVIQNLNLIDIYQNSRATIDQRKFYKNFQLNIATLPDSLFNPPNNESITILESIKFRSKYLNLIEFHYPVNSVENAVLFMYKNDRPGYLYGNILNPHEKISSGVKFPGKILSHSELTETLKIVNDTTNYFYGLIDGVFVCGVKYAGIIFFDNNNSVVGHITICDGTVDIIPRTPITNGRFISFDKIRILVEKIFQREN